MNSPGTVSLIFPDGPSLHPPASVRVEEEDSFTVLSAPPEVPEVGPHPIRVMTAVWEAEPRLVPSVQKHGRRWFLILHDLAKEPTTDESIVRAGLTLLFDEAEREGLESLDVPLFGAVHGVISPTRAEALLAEVLAAKWFHRLKRVLCRRSP